MLRWLGGKVDRWASDKQQDELQQFLLRLKGLSDAEMGIMAAMTSEVAERLKSAGVEPYNPFLSLQNDHNLTIKLSTTIKEMQAGSRFAEASGLMVWLHTFRAEMRLELKLAAKQMWKELERGFKHANYSAAEYFDVSGSVLRTGNADRVPEGFKS